jgi:hypothetical protein
VGALAFGMVVAEPSVVRRRRSESEETSLKENPMVGSINGSFSTFSPSEGIESTGPYDPSGTNAPAPTGTGPYSPPGDGIDLPPPSHNDMFADGGKTVVTCPEGEIAVATTEGGTGTIECKKPKNGKGGGGGKTPTGGTVLD